MKKLSLLLLVFCCATVASAETIHLKNGQTVTGKILEKTDKNVKVDVSGVTMTYYMDEIKDMESAPAVATPPSVATPPAEVVPSQPVVAPAAVVPQAPIASDKKELILKFIDVFGTKSAMAKNLEAMLETMPANDAESKKIKDGIKVDEIIERLLPLYDKQFSVEDLKAFIEFYSSPAGRKLVESIPVIMRDSVEVSTQYFQEKFPELKQENKN